MQHKLLNDGGGQRTFAVVLNSGDEVRKSLQSFVKDRQIRAAQFTAIGALSDVVLKYFDWETKDYREIKVADRSKWHH